MINNYFQNNWKKILNFNSKINLVENPEDLSEQVRIPFTPINIEGYLLYYLFNLLYPKFINDQQNILDLIISDYDIENKILAIYLYITKNAGIHESVELLPKDLFKVDQSDLKDLDNLYNKIQSQILEQKQIKVSLIRIFKKRGIDLINTYCSNLEKTPNLDFIIFFLDLFQKLIQEDLIYLLPEPNILSFFKGIFNIFSNFKVSQLGQLIKILLPDFITTVVFHSEELTFLSIINKTNNSEISIDLKTINELNLELTDHLSKDRLQIIQKKCNSESIFSFRQEQLLELFLELVDLQFPIKKEYFKLMLQKIIFGIRSFEIHWNLLPRPKIYNTLIRFLLRLIGLNINFKKFSHWAIPDFLFNIFDTYFGLNSNVLIILTDDNKIFTKNFLMLEIYNSSLIKTRLIDNSEFSKNKIESLEPIKYHILEKYGCFPIIIKVDKALIQKIMRCFFFKYYKIKPLSLLSIVKMIKKDEFFQITPKLPPYQLLKRKGPFSLLKLLLSIVIDKHEF
ncbi:MAG: hypothetical protein ACFFBH_08425 [Promethearchaeota archaeon]